MEQYLGYAAVNAKGIIGDNFNGVDNKADAEIHFLPSITLDNGVKIGANVQLEAATDGDQIDESFLFIDGAFGRVLMGSENSAGYLMTFSAPDVTFLNVNSGSTSFFVPFSGEVVGRLANTGAPGTLNVGNDQFRRTLGTTFLENMGNNDAQRFTYFTPRFAGFQLGVSYARDGDQDTTEQLNLDGSPLHNIVDIGANYVDSLAGVDISASGRWGIAMDDRAKVPNSDIGDNPQIWSAGLNLGYAGVTIGGSFAEQNNGGNTDGRAWDAGISYETGPWGFSFTYFNGENVDNEVGATGVVNAAGDFRNDEKLQQYLLGVSYLLAKGVALNGYGAYVDFDEDVGDAGGPNEATGDDVRGWVVGTGIKISF